MMTYSLKHQKPLSLRQPLIGSLGLHLGLVALISVALWQQSETIKTQEAGVIAKLQQQEAELVEAEKNAEEDFIREMSQHDLLQDLSSILSDDLKSEILQKLQQDLSTRLEDLFKDQEVFDEDTLNAIRLDMIEEMAEQADELLIDAIIAQMRRYIRQELAPLLVAELERSLKEQGRSVLNKAIQAFIQQHKAHQAGSSIINEALSPIHQQLATAIENSIRNDLVPPATDKVLSKFTSEIKEYGIDGDRLRPLISADITEAMIEALLDLESNEELATLQTRVDYKITDNSQLKEIKNDIDQHITDVENLITEQEKLISEIKEEKDSALEQSDQQITQLKKVYDEAAETLHDAETQNTSHHAWKIGKARNLADLERAVEPNQKANIQIQLENKEQAIKDTEYAKAALEDFVMHMKNTQEVMQIDIDSRTEAITPEAASAEEKQLAKELSRSLAQDIQNLSKTSSQKAIDKMQVEDVLGELGDELEAAIELSHKIAQAKEKLSTGRELDNSNMVSDLSTVLPGHGGINQHQLKQQRVNREAYEAYVKDLKQRTQLGNAYAPSQHITEQASHASSNTKQLTTAQVFISEKQTEIVNKCNKKEAQSSGTKRQLVQADFKSLAFGAASMRQQRIRIDGNLDDWGELKHPMTMKYYADDAENAFTGGIPLYMQWSNEGLYFAYQVPSNHQPVLPSRHSPYSGDVLEVWLDVLNARDLSMKISQSSHQFLLCPFGLRDGEGTLCEYGRGSRGLLNGKIYLDEKEQKGVSRAIKTDSGYTVEAFIANNTLAKPVLTPGMYLAANFSINQQTFGGKYATQWSASKALETQNKPDTWGDIVLLGTDARLRFFNPTTAESDPTFISVGEAIGIEVSDADMNLRSDIKDRVALSLAAEHSKQQVLLVLEETELNSGVFRATCHSQAAFKQAQKNTLGIEQGDVIYAQFNDLRAAYGESNLKVKRALPVAWAVFAQTPLAQKE